MWDYITEGLTAVGVFLYGVGTLWQAIENRKPQGPEEPKPESQRD